MNNLFPLLKRTVLTCTLIFFFTNLNAQSWLELREQGANFYDIKAAFERQYGSKMAEFNRELRQEATRTGRPTSKYEKELEGMIQYKRWAHFVEPRVRESNGDMSAMNTGITQALADLKRHEATSRTGASWSLIGPQSTPSGGGNGRINAVRVQPSTGYLFACAPAGGLFRSTDGGGSWTPSSDGIAVMGATDIAFDPSNNNTMYLATGDGEAGDAYTTGVYKSTDGGNSWSQTGLTLATSAKKTISKIIINPVNGNILVGGGIGIHLSTNGGSSWTQVSTTVVRDLEFKANDPLIVLAGGYASTPVLRSTNGGTTWAASGTGLPTSNWQRVALAVTPLDPTYVYALVSNSTDDGLLGIYLSTDAGLTFTSKYVAPTTPTTTKPNTLGWDSNGADAGGQGWYDLALAVDPSVKTTIYTGGVNLWKSTTSGASWTLNGQWEGLGAPYVHADIHDLTFVGTTLYAGTDGGISKSTNGGAAWANAGSNLPIAQIYSMGISQTNPNLIISGHQDNGTNLTTDGSSWAEVDGGDGMVCFIDHTNNTRMFSEYYNGNISRSTNSGASWTPLTAIPGGDWVTPWMQDPTVANTLYAGGTRVYKSTNSGTTFTSISSTLSVGVIIALDVSKSNTQNIVAASTTGIMRTLNGGTSWTNITAGLPSGVSITSVYYDHSDATKIYVGLASYSGQSVYFSTNSGSTWTNISSGLPSVPVNCFVIQNSTGDLYCGTDIGVYLRSAGTSTWINYSVGMPGIVVKDLEIYAATGKLRAATFARGIWETPVNSNNQAPNVAITAPANASTFSSGTNIVINGTANDPDGSVTRVEFYQGSTLIGTSTSAPYTFTWTNVPTGTYVLTIKAFDDLNAIGTSTTVNINVAVGNDAGVPTIVSPSGTISTASVTPSITLKNFGLTTLTATTISYKIDNDPLSTFNWTGSLATGASTTVTLPVLTGYALGAHTFYAQSGLINSNPDANTPNDGVTVNFTYTVPPACANAVPSPYTQDFNAAASLPTGWVNTSNWLFGATHGNTGNGIYKNLYPSVPTGQFDIVSVGPLATGDLLTFDYRILTYVATGTYPANSPAAPLGWGNILIQVSTNCGSTFTTIHTINDANHIVQKPFVKKSIPLAAYAGQVVVIRVLSTQTAGGWWGDFDNFNIGSQTIPVELKSFNAFSEESHNKIEWTTASEKELKSFQIERSTDNNEWTTIGTTTPKGGSKEMYYSLDDNQPLPLSYYRLRTIELSGKEEVSKIIAVKRFDAKKLVLLNVAPVPTSTGVTVDFSVNKEARIRLVVTNIVGQTVEALTLKAEEGTNKALLNLSNLPNGTYLLTVSDGETREIKRIVKQ